MVLRGFSGASDSKESACSTRDLVRSLGWEDPLEKGMKGYPLQYSCLENPMDRGAWQATVYGDMTTREVPRTPSLKGRIPGIPWQSSG